MKLALWTALLSVAQILIGAQSAHAAVEPFAPPTPAEEAPADSGPGFLARAFEGGMPITARELMLRNGKFELRTGLRSNLSPGAGGSPVNVSPDLYMGLGFLQISFLHSSVDGWLASGSAPASLCFGSSCPSTYNRYGTDMLLGLARGGDFELAMRAGVLFGKVKEVFVGGIARLRLNGGVAIQVESLWDSQDVTVTTPMGGETTLTSRYWRNTVEIQAQVVGGLALALQTGYYAPTLDLSNHRSPLGAIAYLPLGDSLDFGLRFTFDDLLGKQYPDMDRFNARSLGMLLIWH